MHSSILSEIDINEFKDFIFNNSSDVFWVLDENFRTTLISPSIKSLTGYTVEEYLNLTFEQKFTESSQKKLLDLFESFKYKDKFDKLLVEYKTKKNESVLAEVSGIVVRDYLGNIKCVYGISKDLTDKLNLERELLIEKQKNDEAQRFKSIILGIVGHEFRTPLIGILGFTKLLANNTQNEDEKEILNYIYQSAQRLNATLNSIVTLAAIETNQLELKASEIDLMEMIFNLYQSFEPIAKSKNISFDINIKNNTSKIRFDENCLQQILYNLIDNAIKFTEKGRVFLECNTIKIDDKKYIEFVIEDTGIGIKPNKLNIIFEPFRQVSEGHRRQYEGLGLGLTVTKKLIEKFNGTLKLESKPNEGSIFTVRLPLE